MFRYLLSDEQKRKGFVTRTNEYAWNHKDAIDIINFLKQNGYVILGGDVLDKNFEYTYDNWFFENSKDLTDTEKIIESAKKAKQYIDWYYNNFGNDFYYIIVAGTNEDIKQFPKV